MENQRIKILAYRPGRPRQSVRMEKLFASEPLELEYLYSVLKDFGEVRLYDGQVSGKGILREVRRFRPDLVLITSMITNIG